MAKEPNNIENETTQDNSFISSDELVALFAETIEKETALEKNEENLDVAENTKKEIEQPKKKETKPKKTEKKSAYKKKIVSEPIITADELKESNNSNTSTNIGLYKSNSARKIEQKVVSSSVTDIPNKKTKNTSTDSKKLIDPERAKRKNEEKARRSRRRTRQFAGLILGILILVGAYNIVHDIVTSISNISNISMEETKQIYQERIAPLVWFDLLPFEDPAQIDENSLKEALIFGIINKVGNELQHDSMGSAIIPTIDVDAAAAELFGPDFHFTEHAEFTSIVQGITYMYDDTLKAYIVAGTGLELAYAPLVTNVKKQSGGILEVTVGYIATKSNDGNLLQVLDYEHPVRYMDFIFQRDGSEYYLTAMRPNNTIAITSDSSSSSGGSSSSYTESVIPESSQSSVSNIESVPEELIEGGLPAEDGDDAIPASLAAE